MSFPSAALISLTGFASDRKNDRVPWKLIKENTDSFIDQRYLPEAVDQIDDPSDMRKEQISQLLDHWRRPVSGSDLFRFSHVLVNSKTHETMQALYKNSYPVNTDRIDTQSGHPTLPLLSQALTPTIIDTQIQQPTPLLPALTQINTQQPTPSQAPTNSHPTNTTIIDTQSGQPTPLSQPPTPTNSYPINTQSGHPTLDSDIDPFLLKISQRKAKSRPKIPKTTTPVIAPTEPEQSRPVPKARLKTARNLTASSGEPNLNSNDREEGLGRTKRAPKRRLDIYLAAEEKDAMTKRQRKK
jgi:hypothetical protein